MVFQANKPIRIFGEGKGTVSIEFAEKKITKFCQEEKWIVELPSMDYGGPYDLKIFLVCDIDHNDSSSETKFAHLQKNLETLKIPHKHSSDVLLEISYTPSDSLSV